MSVASVDVLCEHLQNKEPTLYQQALALNNIAAALKIAGMKAYGGDDSSTGEDTRLIKALRVHITSGTPGSDTTKSFHCPMSSNNEGGGATSGLPLESRRLAIWPGTSSTTQSGYPEITGPPRYNCSPAHQAFQTAQISGLPQVSTHPRMTREPQDRFVDGSSSVSVADLCNSEQITTDTRSCREQTMSQINQDLQCHLWPLASLETMPCPMDTQVISYIDSCMPSDGDAMVLNHYL